MKPVKIMRMKEKLAKEDKIIKKLWKNGKDVGGRSPNFVERMGLASQCRKVFKKRFPYSAGTIPD